MASTNKTKNYKLNQWLGSDYMKRDDLNSDNALIDTALKYNADSLSAEAAARAAGDSAIRDLVSSEAAARQAADEELNSIIKSGVTMSPSIGLGMNSVIRKTDGITSFPKFTIQGKSYVNMLGRDGNCEDLSKWGYYQCSLTLDVTNKVFGVNGIKTTLFATTGSVSITPSILNKTKYYFMSGYVKNGNAASIQFASGPTGAGSGGVANIATDVTDTTKFTRCGVKIQPSDWGTYTQRYISATIVGASGQYAYIDGFEIVEITATEYSNLTVDQLLEKYPYIDSYACLQNPYVEVRHDNLVRNGTGEEGGGWWTLFSYSGTPTLIVVNGKLRFSNSSNPANRYRQVVNVKPNTNYFISGNLTNYTGTPTMRIMDTSETVDLIASLNQSFNTGNRSQIVILMQNWVTNSNQDYDSLMLIEGTTPPVSYKPCRIERCVIEGKFASDDTLTYENGGVSGLLNWKHRTLYGKDHDWQYSADATGYKQLILSGLLPWNATQLILPIAIKYDGMQLLPWSSTDSANRFWFDDSPATTARLNVTDTDSGWAESSLNPNNDEVKAFMNGWKAVGNNGTRYICWTNILDNTPPPDVPFTTIATSYTSGTSLVVADGTKFAVNDWITVKLTNGMYSNVQITAISGSTLTIASLASAAGVGNYVIKSDGLSTSGGNVITYCKNNIAPGYEGYQLHYKLANPEPITDANVHVHGDIPKLDNGDNYICVDSGMVLGEVVNPLAWDSYVRINSNYGFGGSATWLKSKLETIGAIYRNQIQDAKWTILLGFGPDTYGNGSVYTTLANYDASATYTIDYQILKTLHTTPTAITMQYQQDVLSAVSDLAEGLNSRQKADSVLDGLVDLSMYEAVYSIGFSGLWMQVNTSDYRLRASLGCIPKKATPVITLQNLSVAYLDGAGNVVTIPLSDVAVYLNFRKGNKINIMMSYIGANTTVRTNLKTYGGQFFCDVILDCRGRL